MKRTLNAIDKISLKMVDPDASEEEIIKEIMALPDINQTDSADYSLLILASSYRKIGIVRALLEKGADIHHADKHQGLTALHVAVERGAFEIVQLLLQNGASVHTKDAWGNIPLFRASHMDLNVIDLLLSYGSDYNMANNFGISPYMKFAAYPAIIAKFDAMKGTMS